MSRTETISILWEYINKIISLWQGVCTAEISALDTEGPACHLVSWEARWSGLCSSRWLEIPSLWKSLGLCLRLMNTHRHFQKSTCTPDSRGMNQPFVWIQGSVLEVYVKPGSWRWGETNLVLPFWPRLSNFILKIKARKSMAKASKWMFQYSNVLYC